MMFPFVISLLLGAGLSSSGSAFQPADRTQVISNDGQYGVESVPPVIVNFQGHLRQGSAIVNGTYNMVFRIYSAATGGTPLQTITINNVGVSSGVFNVELPITQSIILNNTNLWVEVEISALGGVYSPRVKINSAAFAYNAFMADTAQRVQDNSINLYDIAGFNEAAATHADMFDWDSNDNGRIDQDLLEVYGSGTDPGYIWNQDTTIQTPGRFWIADSGVIGDTASNRFAVLRMNNNGVYGISDNNTGAGVFGYGVGTFGTYGATNSDFPLTGVAGVYGFAGADNGLGVYGVGAGANGVGVMGIGDGAGGSYYTGTGVVGMSDQIGTYGYGFYGVYGRGDTTSGSIGAYGRSASTGGIGVAGVDTLDYSTGVYGQSPGTMNGNVACALYGKATDPSGYAVIGIGNNIGNITTYTSGAGAQGNGTTFGTIGIDQDGGTGAGVAGSAEGQSLFTVSGTGIGTEGSANTGIGIGGSVNNTSLGWAGYFWGDVNVTGNLQTSLGWYKNGEPTGAIVSVAGAGTPDVQPFYATLSDLPKIYIDGKTKLHNGRATVKIPEGIKPYIDGDNATVVVSSVGSWSGVYVESMDKGSFEVVSGAGDPEAEIAWVMIVERPDAQQIDQYVREKMSRPLPQRVPVESSTVSVRTPVENANDSVNSVKVSSSDSKTEVK